MRTIDGDALWNNMEAADWYNNANRDEIAEKLVLEAPTIDEWISVKDRPPENAGWYWVYAPTYSGGSSSPRENHDGIMFAKWSGKFWSIERGYYNRPGCVEAWMFLPKPPKEEN